ncbi:hypothetical protein ABEG63_05795 [Chryseobacterium sp. C39-AII1]|uniref:hypothetical protein n=1 Tax=Chryseobacterium sp. C39-AII1 TaxID=3080332 RepID=UPI00320AF8F9
MNIKEYTIELKKQTDTIFEESIKKENHLANTYELINNLDLWVKALENKYDCLMIRNSIEEIEISLHQINQGLYRGSFVSLRLALEMITGFVYFSSHNIEFVEWLNGDRDLKWAEISCKENGILSSRFFSAYYKELQSIQEESFSILKNLYRELSEMVHGNYLTWNNSKPELKLDLSKIDLFDNYISNFKKISSRILSLRFLKEIDKNNIEDLMFEETLTINEIRKYIGGPV